MAYPAPDDPLKLLPDPFPLTPLGDRKYKGTWWFPLGTHAAEQGGPALSLCLDEDRGAHTTWRPTGKVREDHGEKR
ncbi:hypothetical protein NDU88_003980 [Pleurodeles waltl]|uniref:Uncharacterized protein n=1 Tax=Pleurodeles waltl TaxID=8319 RepID=A0AAV7SHG8_PLEWA|nr:hypothetical protein NDU88_003980 [Pleurodeles waltl]